MALTVTKHLNSLKVALTGNKMELSQTNPVSVIIVHKFLVLHGNYFTESFQIAFEKFFLFFLESSLIFFPYSTLICNSKYMCKTIFKCSFYTFFLNITIKNCNSMASHKILRLYESIYNIHYNMMTNISNHLTKI